MKTPKRKDPRSWFLALLLVIVVVVAWFMAPYFLPVYAWLHLDWNTLATETGIPLEQLQEERDFVFRYAPRGENDPTPWQLISHRHGSVTPDWMTDEHGTLIDEYQTLIRVHIVSDGHGDSPSTMWINAGITSNIYWEARGWRLPPGSLGRSGPRGVVLIRQSSWRRCNYSQALFYDGTIRRGLRRSEDLERGWISDDDPYLFPYRQDGYQPPERQKEEQEPENDEP